MQVILEWLAEQGITRVDLHATEMGRQLYERVGFVDNHGMIRLKLE